MKLIDQYSREWHPSHEGMVRDHVLQFAYDYCGWNILVPLTGAVNSEPFGGIAARHLMAIEADLSFTTESPVWPPPDAEPIGYKLTIRECSHPIDDPSPIRFQEFLPEPKPFAQPEPASA